MLNFAALMAPVKQRASFGVLLNLHQLHKVQTRSLGGAEGCKQESEESDEAMVVVSQLYLSSI